MLRSLNNATLNHLLTHELMAAEGCRNASTWFAQLPVAPVLREVMEGHHLRAGVLYQCICDNEGHPTVDPRRQDTGGPKPASSDIRTLLALLLDLEQRGVAAYRTGLRHLSGPTRTMVEAELLPAQERALGTISGVQPPILGSET